MRRIRGIKGFQVRKARIATLPSRLGACEVCHEEGEVHYFVAAKLPRFLYLCDEHYLPIRDRLEQALRDILREEGL